MAILRGLITYTRSPELTAKQMRPALEEANKAAVIFWHVNYLPGHFTVEGGRKYGYKPRSGEGESNLVYSKSTNPRYAGRLVSNRKYYWTKWRKKKTHDPLVFTGSSKESATRAIRVTATAKSGRGVMLLPKYFYQYRKDLNQPDKAAELVKVVTAEVAEMAKVHGAVMAKMLNAASEHRSVVAT